MSWDKIDTHTHPIPKIKIWCQKNSVHFSLSLFTKKFLLSKTILSEVTLNIQSPQSKFHFHNRSKPSFL